jgi:predicted RNA-binding protein with PIN domain
MQMPILVDGHNLIARMPDLSLDDPDDEAKLVERLRRFQARTGKRLTVVFDGGLPGGVEPDLSTSKLQVVFAPAGRTADALIVRRVQRDKDARGLTVVTSDRRVMDAIERLGAKAVRSESFVADLNASPASGESDDIVLSESELEEWLDVFKDNAKVEDHNANKGWSKSS